MVRSILLLCSILLAGCTAADDFSAFRFGADGGTTDGGASDGAPGADLQMAAAVGDPCVASCTNGLTCYTMMGNATFPGGMCSAPCDPQAPNCPTGSVCGQVENNALCLPLCSGNTLACRSGYSCCAGQKQVTGPGACAPTSTNFCGN